MLAPAPYLKRSWYRDTIPAFHKSSENEVLAQLARGSSFNVIQAQGDAWLAEISILRKSLAGHTGVLHLEFAIPRMGHRVDAVVLANGIVLTIEFKIGAAEYSGADMDQAYDYAIDLKYFHEASHDLTVVPILVASEARGRPFELVAHAREAGLYQTVCANAENLGTIITNILDKLPTSTIDPLIWEESRYCPTPTIIEAARALYAGHGVGDISRNDAGATNLGKTSDQIEAIIETSRSSGHKSLCFVTGVPGAGKTLVGLNIATKYNDVQSELHSVFLSGNGPLVAILREALARDTVGRERAQGRKIRKGDAVTQVKAFIQNVHHFRDECLRSDKPPVDHVALFDEAQRAWDREQTASFMSRKKGLRGFNASEPEFLISCMNRRKDWAVIVCLVGGGQEINTGEAGISEWIDALRRECDDWHVYISPALKDSEYAAGQVLGQISGRAKVHYVEELHLSVSMRSFRAEKVSEFVKTVLDCECDQARGLLQELGDRYPIALTRELDKAKQWLKDHASGSERYGIIVSSQAERLKPYAMDVRTPVNPVKWFLDGKDDVRSSYYLEDVATEFHVQGLELDWACVSWDGDFSYTINGWRHLSFRGSKWQRIKSVSRQNYLKNAYRVLLTRARQGMVIFVPPGCTSDPTRDASYYDSTYSYLRSIGLTEL